MAFIWSYLQNFWLSRFWGHWGQKMFNVKFWGYDLLKWRLKILLRLKKLLRLKIILRLKILRLPKILLKFKTTQNDTIQYDYTSIFECSMMRFDMILQTCWNFFNTNMMKYFCDYTKPRLKTSFRPKPRVQIVLFNFYKVNYRQKARFKTANSRLYEIPKKWNNFRIVIASYLDKFKLV